MVSDANLTTPVKLPTSPAHWYNVKRSGFAARFLEIEATPTAHARHRAIYTWRVKYVNGTHRDYNGKTIQPLIRRSQQHLRQAKTAPKARDVFHKTLLEFAKNPPGSQIDEVSLGIARLVPPAESVSKTEQLYISGKQTLVKEGGFNQINANAQIQDRLERDPKKLEVAFQAPTAVEPRQMVMKKP